MQKVVISLIALLAVGTGVWLGADYTGKRPELTAVTLLSKGYALPRFSLTDKNGQPFTGESLRGQWTLVFTGFTNCGHVCPMAMGKVKLIYDELQEPAQVLFVSVDPERDSTDTIKEYAESFDASFNAATGTPAELDKLTTAIEAPWRIDRADGKYVVDHSSDIILINPAGAYAGFISQPINTTAVATELNQLLNR